MRKVALSHAGILHDIIIPQLTLQIYLPGKLFDVLQLKTASRMHILNVTCRMFTCEFLCTVTKAMNHKIQFLFIKNFFTILLICVGLYNHVIRIFKSFMKVSESFIVNMKITSSIFICSPNATL